MFNKLILSCSLYVAFSLLFLFNVSAQIQIPQEKAQEIAQDFIDEIAQYSLENPSAPSSMPQWEEAYAGTPYLVHGYSDLKGYYYLVPVKNTEDQVISVISIDANDGKWHYYYKFPAKESLLSVNRKDALDILLADFGITASLDSIILVMMPNKTLYWHYRIEEFDLIKEYFINVSNPQDVHTEIDKDEAGLTKPVDISQPRHTESLSEERWQEEVPLYPTSYNITSVPHYYQVTSYHCGPASLEMVFDYWGPNVNQTDIGHVANTIDPPGTDPEELRRSSHFSYISTAIQDPGLQGYNERDLGYGSLEKWWSYDPDYIDRYNDLKTLISNDYPIIVPTWYDDAHLGGHLRVVKGYNDATDVFIVHDPWYNAPYYGPDVNFNQSFFVDDLWTLLDRWGLHSSPWKVDISSPSTVNSCEHFTVSATFEYRGPHPYEGQDAATDPQATIILPSGYTLESSETATKSISGIGSSNSSDSASWNVIAPSYASTEEILIEAKGLINDSSTDYPSYSDWIGGENQTQIQSINTDADCDGTINSEDPDDDNDGTLDENDNCPLVYNPANLDTDGDGIGDFCDICPGDYDPGQVDTDNDDAGDACDCQPGDPNDRRPPNVMLSVIKTGTSTIDLSWYTASGADSYSMTRGDLSLLSSTDYGSCLEEGISSTTYSDSDIPSVGDGFIYMVQGHSFDCGIGPLGYKSTEAERMNDNPSACQGQVHSDAYPESEETLYGTVQGALEDTWSSNDQVEAITEKISQGGNPDLRYSLLEHRWTIQVVAGSKIEFHVEGFRSSSLDGDDFHFGYSTNGGTTWNPLSLSILPLADNDTDLIAILPSSLSGTVIFRVVDTNQTEGHQNLDTVRIDELFVRSIS